MPEELTLRIKTELEALDAVQEPLDAYLEAKHVGPEAAYALRLALEELLTNRIKYGFEYGQERFIDVAVSRLEDGSLKLTISDEGDDFNPVAAPDPVELGNPVAERGIGGLGLHMVKKLCASLEHSRKDGRNTLTVIVKDKESGTK